jgi:hypothetical protein
MPGGAAEGPVGVGHGLLVGTVVTEGKEALVGGVDGGEARVLQAQWVEGCGHSNES